MKQLCKFKSQFISKFDSSAGAKRAGSQHNRKIQFAVVAQEILKGL